MFCVLNNFLPYSTLSYEIYVMFASVTLVSKVYLTAPVLVL